MDVTHVFAGIPLAERDGAIDWYGRLVGGPPDLFPNEREGDGNRPKPGEVSRTGGSTGA